jgi:hypothetical protein
MLTVIPARATRTTPAPARGRPGSGTVWFAAAAGSGAPGRPGGAGEACGGPGGVPGLEAAHLQLAFRCPRVERGLAEPAGVLFADAAGLLAEHPAAAQVGHGRDEEGERGARPGHRRGSRCVDRH